LGILITQAVDRKRVESSIKKKKYIEERSGNREDPIMGCNSSSSIASETGGSPRQSYTNFECDFSKKARTEDEAVLTYQTAAAAIKALIRDDSACASLMNFLETINMEEYLRCYMDVAEFITVDPSQLVSRTAAFIWRYKAMNDDHEVRRQKKKKRNSRGQILKICLLQRASVWQELGDLTHLDVMSASHDQLVKHLKHVQANVLSKLSGPFETYLRGPDYKAWELEMNGMEKRRMSNSKSYSSTCLESICGSSLGSTMSSPGCWVRSNNFYAGTY
jgi:hypothetical protein